VARGTPIVRQSKTDAGVRAVDLTRALCEEPAIWWKQVEARTLTSRAPRVAAEALEDALASPVEVRRTAARALQPGRVSPWVSASRRVTGPHFRAKCPASLVLPGRDGEDVGEVDQTEGLPDGAKPVGVVLDLRERTPELAGAE
jgi:hypothetical protein